MAERRHDGAHTRESVDLVARDLAALGRQVETPASADMATAVRHRISALPAPRVRRDVPHRFPAAVLPRAGTRRARIALVVGVALLAAVVSPPVRAAVAEWLGFGAVRLERGEPAPGPASPPPVASASSGTSALSLSAAAAAVDFPLWLPEALGPPDGVEVSADRRRVSLSWGLAEDGEGAGVRLDQFGAALDYSVIKRTPDLEFAQAHGDLAVWLEEAHEVTLLLADGTPVTESARLAGPTLLWQQSEVTLRLEGDLDLERAVEIAESTVPAD